MKFHLFHCLLLRGATMYVGTKKTNLLSLEQLRIVQLTIHGFVEIWTVDQSEQFVRSYYSLKGVWTVRREFERSLNSLKVVFTVPAVSSVWTVWKVWAVWAFWAVWTVWREVEQFEGSLNSVQSYRKTFLLRSLSMGMKWLARMCTFA